MFTLTDEAAALIQQLADDAITPQRPVQHAGLRIVVDPRHDSLSMSLASAPKDGDEVVAHAGAQVYLSEAASSRLHRRTLRASSDEHRAAFFLDD